MSPAGGDNGLVTEAVHLLDSYDIEALLDEIASAVPPAYLHRCFGEGIATAHLSWPRVQQLAACAMIVDAVVSRRDYAGLEPELIADWREHYAAQFAPLRALASKSLQWAQKQAVPAPAPEALAELHQLEQRLAAA